MICLNCCTELPATEDVVIISCPNCGWTTVTDTAFPLDSNPAVVKTGPNPDDPDRKIYCYSPLSKKLLEESKVGRELEVAILKFLTKGWDSILLEDQKLLHELISQDPATLRMMAESFVAKARLIETLRARMK